MKKKKKNNNNNNKPGVLERPNLVNVERDRISFAILVVGR
jgi:hypothetical protein